MLTWVTSATSRMTNSSKLPRRLTKPVRRWTEAQPWTENRKRGHKVFFGVDGGRKMIIIMITNVFLTTAPINMNIITTITVKEEVLMGGRKAPGPRWIFWSGRHWHVADTNTGILARKMMIITRIIMVIDHNHHQQGDTGRADTNTGIIILITMVMMVMVVRWRL